MADKSPAQLLKSIDNRLRVIQIAAILFIVITLLQCLVPIILITTFGGAVRDFTKGYQEGLRQYPIATPYQYP
jgi:hypothetical protein